jgi:hypothetical protein
VFAKFGNGNQRKTFVAQQIDRTFVCGRDLQIMERTTKFLFNVVGLPVVQYNSDETRSTSSVKRPSACRLFGFSCHRQVKKAKRQKGQITPFRGHMI